MKKTDKKAAVPTDGKAAAKAKLAEATKGIRELLAEVDRSHVRIGLACIQVIKGELAEAAGYKSADDYFSRTFDGQTKSTLSVCRAVAEVFTEEICALYGTWNLYHLTSYAKVAKLPKLPADPGGVPVKVPDTKGEVQSKPFSQCTKRDLLAAIKWCNPDKPSQPPPSKVPEFDAWRVNAIQGSMTTIFGEEIAPKVNARAVNDRTLVTIENIPLSQMEDAVRAINDGLEAKASDNGSSGTVSTVAARRPKAAARKERKRATASRRSARR